MKALNINTLEIIDDFVGYPAGPHNICYGAENELLAAVTGYDPINIMLDAMDSGGNKRRLKRVLMMYMLDSELHKVKALSMINDTYAARFNTSALFTIRIGEHLSVVISASTSSKLLKIKNIRVGSFEDYSIEDVERCIKRQTAILSTFKLALAEANMKIPDMMKLVNNPPKYKGI